MISQNKTIQVVGAGAGALLLAAGVALGFMWGSSGTGDLEAAGGEVELQDQAALPGSDAPAAVPSQDHGAHDDHDAMPDPAADEMVDMDDMQEMEDPEGMDMVGEGVLRVTRPVAGALGLTSAEARLEPLTRRVRATGHVDYDETRLTGINPKIGGWVEALHVDFTGRQVTEGEPLMEIYSPELVSAQEELLSAHRLEESLRGSDAPGVEDRSGRLVESARERLRQWDISQDQIEAIEETGEVQRTLTLHAPRSGFVVEKNVEEGSRVNPGTDVYRLADLSTVWLEVDLHEQDLRFAQVGDRVEVHVDAYPGGNRQGTVSYIYPDVRRDSRTGRARVHLSNNSPGEMVKPGMFATAYLEADVADRAVTVPRDAVMHTGEGALVFVELGPGTYEVRDVQVGTTVGDRTQILEGVLAGEPVVARAGFILDAESRLMEEMGGHDMPGMDHGADDHDDHDGHEE